MTVEDFIPLAIKLAGKYRIDDDRGQPTEDTETYAEALLIIHHAIESFDPAVGVDPLGYVSMCVRRRLYSFRRVRNRQSQHTHLSALFARPHESATAENSAGFDHVIDHRNRTPYFDKEDVGLLRDRTPEKHRKTFDQLYEAMQRGETQTQTYARLRKNSRQVWNQRIARLRKTLAGAE